MIDGVVGSGNVLEDAVTGKVNPVLESGAKEVVRPDLSIEINGNTGLLCAFCDSGPEELSICQG